MATLSPTHAQQCVYCYQDFVPVKRGTQKFCSGSCRTTYSKKKKRGTLGRFTHLPGPHGGVPVPEGTGTASFGQQVLAAGTGALAANVVSQTAEYFGVTQGLAQEVKELKRLVQMLVRHHSTSTGVMVAGLRHLLAKSGVLPADITRVLLPAGVEVSLPVQAARAAPAAPIRRTNKSHLPS